MRCGIDLLGVVFCLGCLSVPAAADTIANVSVSNVAAVPGTSIDVPVLISPADYLCSYDLMVSYDTTALSLTTMSVGNIIPSDWWFFSNLNGDCGTAYAMAFSPTGSELSDGTGAGTLLDLDFTVLSSVAPGTISTITVSQDPASDPPLNDGGITMDASPGVVDVVPEPASLVLLAAAGLAGLARLVIAQAQRRLA